MELEDIIKAQEELVEESRKYFENWYEKEEEFRKEFTGEEED
jgi:hypothetical protein